MQCPNCGEEMKNLSMYESDPGIDICRTCGYSYDYKHKVESWQPRKRTPTNHNRKKRRDRDHELAHRL